MKDSYIAKILDIVITILTFGLNHHKNKSDDEKED